MVNQVIDRECRDPRCFPDGYIPAPRADAYLHWHKVDAPIPKLSHSFGPVPDERDIYECRRCELRLSSLTPRDIMYLNFFGVCCKDEPGDED